LATEKVKQRMLEEAHRLECEIEGTEVVDWPTLREFYTKGIDNDIIAMHDVAIMVFEESLGWMSDTEGELLDRMGWVYDPSSLIRGANNLGNAIVEKMVSRAKSDVRTGLRKCCKNGRSGFTLPIKRPECQRFVNTKYVRRVPGVRARPVVPGAHPVVPVPAAVVPPVAAAAVVPPAAAAAVVPPAAAAAAAVVPKVNYFYFFLRFLTLY
jgi:hypothetical protein